MAELKRDALKRPLYLFRAASLVFLLGLHFLFFQRKKRTIGVRTFTVLKLGSPLNHLARVQLRFRPGFNFSVHKYNVCFSFFLASEMKLRIPVYHELGAPVVQPDLIYLSFACILYKL